MVNRTTIYKDQNGIWLLISIAENPKDTLPVDVVNDFQVAFIALNGTPELVQKAKIYPAKREDSQEKRILEVDYKPTKKVNRDPRNPIEVLDIEIGQKDPGEPLDIPIISVYEENDIDPVVVSSKVKVVDLEINRVLIGTNPPIAIQPIVP